MLCLKWMARTVAVAGFTLALACATPAADKDKAEKGKDAAKPAATEPARPAKEKAVSNEELLGAMEQLRNLISEQNRKLDAQQQRIAELENRVTSESNAAVAAATAAPAPDPQQAADIKKIDDRLVGVETDFGAYKKANDGKVGKLGPFSYSGDVRARIEPFRDGGAAASPNADRNRFRYRLRFNATAKLNDEFSGGFSLGSGDTNDPISTNQTITGAFTRKPFFIDRAFIKYSPKWAKPLSITGGKFGYTWYRTELTWDNDLNPEGLSETLAWSFKNPFLEKIAFVAFQSPVIEVSGGKDTFIFGGQFQSNWKLGDYVKFGGYLGYYNYQNADPLRAARQAGTVGGSSNSNSASTNGSQFNSKFGLLDAIARLDFKTPMPKFPIMLQLDFVTNTRACDNVVNIPVANRTACDATDDSGYWADILFGRQSEAGDIQFGYSYIHIEREALVDAFNFSDLRLPTNDMNHRIIINYQWYRNIQLGFTGLFGRQLVTTSSPTKESTLKRLQFDIIYKF